MAWYAPNSAVHVTLTLFTPAVDPTIPLLLMEAYNTILERMMQHGESALIPQGVFSWQGNNHLFFRAWNTDVNHEMNWKILLYGLGALWDYLAIGGFGTLRFTIYDGGNEVGRGTVGA